uniref:Uncharacterized protein n=1 Tax=Corvus moneduloides TaxID=1196302 RepID=A0A8C3EBB7_CORMO
MAARAKGVFSFKWVSLGRNFFKVFLSFAFFKASSLLPNFSPRSSQQKQQQLFYHKKKVVLRGRTRSLKEISSCSGTRGKVRLFKSFQHSASSIFSRL